MTRLWAKKALTETGWQEAVLVTIDVDGRISSVVSGAAVEGRTCSILLPAPANLHSHGFQRVMAGLTERRLTAGGDSFWTWRRTMYGLLEQLMPEDVEAITALAQVEMLEAGFASVAEFHYLHHQPDGGHYERLGEMSSRIMAAAGQSGIGLTLLPVLYEQGDCDGRPVEGAQRRFACNLGEFELLITAAQSDVRNLPADCQTGIALHSMRTVSLASIGSAGESWPQGPLHIHAAEQEAEIDSVRNAIGSRPVQWLLENCRPDHRWCLVHSTHLDQSEISDLARSGAVAGLCPVTEANLGDGIFAGGAFLQAGGMAGIGTDSNVSISLVGELRTLEYSQRLGNRIRAALAIERMSVGRELYDLACQGGARACGRDCGRIGAGAWADLVELEGDSIELAGLDGDSILDSWIFASVSSPVRNVWSAGRHMVRDGRHIHRQDIAGRYLRTQARVRERARIA